MMNLKTELFLSPEGHVLFDTSDRAAEELPSLVVKEVKAIFDQGSIKGLLHLGVHHFEEELPPSFLFWQKFARLFITTCCKLGSVPVDLSSLSAEKLEEIVATSPFMQGSLFLTSDVLDKIWHNLKETLYEETQNTSLSEYLKQKNSPLNLVGRICFHLAENKNDATLPFAFLATYTTKLSDVHAPQHLPLKKALSEYAGENNRAGLLNLLLPIQRAAHKSSFLQNLFDSGALFQPQGWSTQEAYHFLKDIPLFEESGIMVRVPSWWNAQKPPRPKVSISIGETNRTVLGLETLLTYDMKLALQNGEELTREEWENILRAESPLVKVKEQWVEVNPEKLKEVLSFWEFIQHSTKNGLSMKEALRLLSGISPYANQEPEHTQEWSSIHAGSWLQSVLNELRSPTGFTQNSFEPTLSQYLHGQLRPYQQVGVKWLFTLYQLKLGGCLADDMGLGKTIQVLSLFLITKHHLLSSHPHLLVVPASLLGSWQAEVERFAPSLRLHIEHPSSTTTDTPSLSEFDVVITTYGFLLRSSWLKEIDWDLVILDEAQMIKNPSTKQTRAVKTLKSKVRLTLTGTPVENRLGDLWSLFDFTSPGLLGTSTAFSSYTKKADSSSYIQFVSALRSLTQPYILRRMKTDKRIITDLPDKSEVQTFCFLSEDQIRLYQQAIQELGERLYTSEGVERRGLVLSSLLRLKQICNHPDQWLGYGEFLPTASGKFLRLQEITEEIAAKQEKVLIFTQFREIIPAISSFLSTIFGREGLELHGDTPIKKRAELVKQFQNEKGPPFFVLSLKAGGTGLTLTRASHVIHFDRWWNPSVENQATDRAYRIGQHKAVLVHKFTCRGTIEEKIDELIASKEKLARDILQSDKEVSITELSNEELLKLVSLDIHRALATI